MYEAFFGLRERAFQLTSDPRFLYLNPGHREALATLRYGLTSSPGITLLLGEAGTGKSVLLRAALRAEQQPEHRYVVLRNPTLTRSEFYEVLAEGFGLPHTTGSKSRFLLEFERAVVARHKKGGVSALIVDEAQSLTHELFEEVRLLANLEAEADAVVNAPLVNIVLAGQPELAARLADPSLREFHQRITLRCSLAPLNLNETAAYIAGRLSVAGADALDVFTKDAVLAVYKGSHGIPRTIGVICENALLGGFAAQLKPVDRDVVDQVCRDFGFLIDSRSKAAPAMAPSVTKHSQPASAHEDEADVPVV